MTPNNKELSDVLDSADRIIKHQKEIKILKGENFNIFSILRLENKENTTHSAFLGELLNPRGSHELNTIFLELFLKSINYSSKFDLNSASLEIEKYIGKIDNENKTGGRIDLYISDSLGNSILIENKIYAQDQSDQIIRYVNYKKDQNTVYYLTLTGCEPSDYSKGNLIKEDHFYCISYKETIINSMSFS